MYAKPRIHLKHGIWNCKQESTDANGLPWVHVGYGGTPRSAYLALVESIQSPVAYLSRDGRGRSVQAVAHTNLQ